VPGEEIPPETADRVGLYRSVLARSAGPVLAVLDNASSTEQVHPLLPGDARHCVLVTSRHLLPQLGARQLVLSVLSPDEAVGLLDAAVHAADLSGTRVIRDLSSSRRVASYCGHLPLALQIAAALLVFEPAKPVAELAGDLAQAHTRLDYLDDGERAVRAAFDLSYHRLPPDQARLFRLLGVHPAGYRCGYRRGAGRSPRTCHPTDAGGVGARSPHPADCSPGPVADARPHPYLRRAGNHPTR